MNAPASFDASSCQGIIDEVKRAIGPLAALLATCLAGHEARARPLTPPRSSAHELLDLEDIDQRVAPFVDVAALLEEDAKLRDEPTPYRVAYSSALSLGLEDAGTSELLPDGGRVWRVRIRSPGAVFMSFKFSEFELPAGAELHFISLTRDYYDGPYTRRHSPPSGRFGSPMIPGDSAVIELFLPPNAEARLRLESVSHGYRDAMGMGAFPLREGAPAPSLQTGAPAAPLTPSGPFSCQRDVNCPEGAPYQDVKRAAAEGYDGTYVCSGQLLNNVRQDNRYLYITAEHCEWWLDPSTMVYYWNYENSGCGTGDAPLIFSTGSSDLHHDAASDIQLLELDGTDLEASYDIYFTGWNRSGVAPSSAATISFPATSPSRSTSRTTRSRTARRAAAPRASGRTSGGWKTGTWASPRGDPPALVCSTRISSWWGSSPAASEPTATTSPGKSSRSSIRRGRACSPSWIPTPVAPSRFPERTTRSFPACPWLPAGAGPCRRACSCSWRGAP